MIDFLFQDATVVDGSGSRPFVGDVAIRGDRIDRIGVVPPGEARVVIDACAMVLCPGFIDMHSHSDLVCANGRPVPHKVMQGVTTELIGQDGISAAPLTPASMPLMAEIIEPLSGKLQRPWTAWDMRGFLDALKHTGIQTNVMTLTGHCNLRIAAMGHRMAAASDEDLARMQAMLAESLEQGSCGLSLGLIYPPSSASNTRELIQLGHTVMQYDRIMIAHIRDEQDGLLEALDEMISVGSESGCRVHISHLKCMGKRNWGRMPQVLERLDRAAGRGIRISFDQYPYDASSTTLSMLLPAWAMEGGVDGFRNCTADADSRGKVLAHLRAAIERRGGPQSIRIASAPCADGTFLAGKDLKAIAEAWKSAAEEAVLRILQETQLSAIAIYHAMSSEDVELAMRHPLHSVGSDGVLGEHPHPRAYGTFPRIIGHYHARQGLFTLEEAVYKMTFQPARIMNLVQRGLVREGYFADLVVFELGKFTDHATYDRPKEPPSGLQWVFINGKPVVSAGRMETVFPGQVLVSGSSQA